MNVELDLDGTRADIVLNRPEVHNAMNWDVFDELVKAVDEVASAPDVRVAVVSGRGPSFSSGIDTTMFDSGSASFEEMIRRAQAGYRKLAALPMPTVAMVHGHALGAGCQLALACDLRVVAADADIGILEAKFALVPDLGGRSGCRG